MKLSVMAFSWTAPDWRVFQTLTQASLGRSVTRSLDARGTTARTIAEYVAALGEFQKRGTDAVAVLRDPGSLLKHVMVSFIVAGTQDDFYELAIDGDVDILDTDGNPEIVICSASLERWRTSIVSYCSARGTDTQRTFYKVVLEQFDRLGLSKLFDNYSRSTAGGNLLLVEKR